MQKNSQTFHRQIPISTSSLKYMTHLKIFHWQSLFSHILLSCSYDWHLTQKRKYFSNFNIKKSQPSRKNMQKNFTYIASPTQSLATISNSSQVNDIFAIDKAYTKLCIWLPKNPGKSFATKIFHYSKLPPNPYVF